MAWRHSLAHSDPRDSSPTPGFSDNKPCVPSRSLRHHKRVNRLLISKAHWNHSRLLNTGPSRMPSTKEDGCYQTHKPGKCDLDLEVRKAELDACLDVSLEGARAEIFEKRPT